MLLYAFSIFIVDLIVDLIPNTNIDTHYVDDSDNCSVSHWLDWLVAFSSPSHNILSKLDFEKTVENHKFSFALLLSSLFQSPQMYIFHVFIFFTGWPIKRIVNQRIFLGAIEAGAGGAFKYPE